ncbi:MAG: ectoine/hydroxyectoine ABC transporter permease subunit EhuC [Desulfobacterales bacterium]|nr:ectoine/hydroxyectoine ABC transporter permease subunit EhuC [Desulfobacterales bacterium]
MTYTQMILVLLNGFKVTVWVTLISTVMGGIFSFAFGIGKMSRFWPVRIISDGYIEIFRGTSLLVQLFWLFYALPLLGVSLSPMSAGIWALSLNIGAYGAEVVRGAILAVDTGQYEAAKALNFTPSRTLWKVLIPQAVVEMMPPFGNLVVQNMKDSALVSLITLSDLTFKAQTIRNETLQTVPIYVITLLLYFLLALVLTGIMKWLERILTTASGREGVR